MIETDKAYFVTDGILFCNTLFKKDGCVDDDVSIENSDSIKSFYDIEFIVAGNMSGIKGHSTIRTADGHSYTVEVPFKELVKLKYGIEL